MQFPFKKRIRQILRRLDREAPAALLVSAAPAKVRNRDCDYPYRQDSDFFYLTGIEDGGFALLLSSQHAPLLFAHPEDPHQALWHGASTPVKNLAARIGSEACISKDIRSEIRTRLRGVERLYFQNTHESLAWNITSELLALRSYQRTNYPGEFIHCDALLAEMRLIKDKSEIEAIRAAAQITNAALYGAMSLVRPNITEKEIAGAIEFYFRSHNATSSFNPIVAAGHAATTLHYERCDGILKQGQLLLLDVGAEHNLYAGDITRTVPVNGRFNPQQADVYNVVLNAQRTAIKKIRPGVTMDSVHHAAAMALTEGLVDLGALRGKVSKLVKDNAYKRFFPHGIGHSLGIDVHDITGLNSRAPLELKKGMVVTIEPGLYFPKRAGRISPCGIRIEDDVLVTAGGSEVLSEGFPKKINEIEALFG